MEPRRGRRAARCEFQQKAWASLAQQKLRGPEFPPDVAVRPRFPSRPGDTATTDGRGGMPSLKSGQRVGLREIHALAGVLYRQEQRLAVGREGAAAHLGVDTAKSGLKRPRPGLPYRQRKPRRGSCCASALSLGRSVHRCGLADRRRHCPAPRTRCRCSLSLCDIARPAKNRWGSYEREHLPSAAFGRVIGLGVFATRRGSR